MRDFFIGALDKLITVIVQIKSDNDGSFCWLTRGGRQLVFVSTIIG